MTSNALVVVEEAPPPVAAALFGTHDPAGIVQRASAVATALADVVAQQELFTEIGSHRHVHVEGWTLLGTMLGVFPVVVWSRPVRSGDGGGWEARAEARTLGGQVVGAAEAQCVRDESVWADRPDYALRSMAQTRAVSKALRMPLGFVMTLAGYAATPAEEMDGVLDNRRSRDIPATVSRSGAPRNSPARAEAGTVPPVTEPQIKAIYAIGRSVREWTDDDIEAHSQELYGRKPSELNRRQASELIDKLRGDGAPPEPR